MIDKTMTASVTLPGSVKSYHDTIFFLLIVCLFSSLGEECDNDDESGRPVVTGGGPPPPRRLGCDQQQFENWDMEVNRQELDDDGRTPLVPLLLLLLLEVVLVVCLYQEVVVVAVAVIFVIVFFCLFVLLLSLLLYYYLITIFSILSSHSQWNHISQQRNQLLSEHDSVVRGYSPVSRPQWDAQRQSQQPQPRNRF